MASKMHTIQSILPKYNMNSEEDLKSRRPGKCAYVGSKTMFVSRRVIDISGKNTRQRNKLSRCKHCKICSSSKASHRGNDKDASSDLSFKSTVTQFMQRSSIYSLNQIGNSVTLKRKVFWSIITIVGLVGCMSQIGIYLDCYKKYPVVVNIHIVQKEYQKFPAVTVCNVNNIRNQYFECFLRNINYTDCKNDSHPVSFDDISKGFYKSKDSYDSKDYFCDAIPSYFSYGNIEFKKWRVFFVSQNYSHRVAYGHQAKNFIKSCDFNGAACSIEDFHLSPNYHLGNCYTFNRYSGSHPTYAIHYTGPNAGLELDLDIEVEEYIPFAETEGARAYVHHPHDQLFLSESGINLSPGVETSVALKRLKMNRLPPPYKDHCINYADGDSMKKCMFNCDNNLVFNSCSCMLDMSAINGVRHCNLTDSTDFCCILNLPKSNCGCLAPCSETFYDMKISSMTWPSTSFHKSHTQRFMNKKVSGTVLKIEDVRATRLKLKVYFDSLDNTVYDQKPMYHRSELFSQVGGHLSLWLGLSLVAIFECLENLVVLGFGRCRQAEIA